MSRGGHGSNGRATERARGEDAERDERAARSSRGTSIGASGCPTVVDEVSASKRMQGRGKSEEHKNLVEVAALSQHTWVGGDTAS